MLITKEIANRVKIKRALFNMSKNDLMKRLNISFQTLKKVENGDYDMNRKSYDRLIDWLEN